MVALSLVFVSVGPGLRLAPSLSSCAFLFLLALLAFFLAEALAGAAAEAVAGPAAEAVAGARAGAVAGAVAGGGLNREGLVAASAKVNKEGLAMASAKPHAVAEGPNGIGVAAASAKPRAVAEGPNGIGVAAASVKPHGDGGKLVGVPAALMLVDRKAGLHKKGAATLTGSCVGGRLLPKLPRV